MPQLYDAWFSQKCKLGRKMYKVYVQNGDIKNTLKYRDKQKHISSMFRHVNGKDVEITSFSPIEIRYKPFWKDAVYIGQVRAWIYNIYD